MILRQAIDVANGSAVTLKIVEASGDCFEYLSPRKGCVEENFYEIAPRVGREIEKLFN